METVKWHRVRAECAERFPFVLESPEHIRLINAIEALDEILEFATDHFGPDGLYRWSNEGAEGLDPDCSWAFDGGRFWFKSLADATMFRLRWC